MRIVSLVLSTAIGLAVITATAIALPALGVAGSAITPFTVAMVALWAAGFCAGVVPVISLRDPSALDGRRASRVFVVVVGAVTVSVLLLLIGLAVTGGAPFGVATLTIGAAVAYIAANAFAGRVLRRRADRRRRAPLPIPPMDPDLPRRRTRTIVIVSSAVLVFGALFALAAGRSAAEPDSTTIGAVGIAVSFAAITATVFCAITVVGFSGRSRELSGPDARLLKRIARVVVGGKSISLTREETELAARYAPYAAETERWSLAQLLTLFVAFLALNEPTPEQPLQLAMWIVFPVLSVILIPTSLRRARRAEHFARAHGVEPAGASLPTETMTRSDHP
ncbi:hypothetical protein [Labedella endophytica]|uniref:Uncharacterized protein n=1 Tax=Labedella endophytica TaxID=1523160 RepID=A0A3S0X0P7_9MICO|nr:hypothetical protein [Labedella endophytica]RUR03158.1 hypothetical protein ELQ94_00955 [Labedella endophytica]